MAAVAKIIELGPNGGKPVRRTVADGTTISKLTLCSLADPNTAVENTGRAVAFAGILAHDKLASDGSVTASFYTEGVFDITASTDTAIVAGDMLVLSGANLVSEAVAADLLTGAIMGKAEETASASEVIRVRLIGY